MKRIAKRAALPVTALLMASVFAQSAATAMPTSWQHQQLTQTKPLVDEVYWRRGWGWGPGWWEPGAVVGGLIIGGALVASAIAEHRATDSHPALCRRFSGVRPPERDLCEPIRRATGVSVSLLKKSA